MNSQALKGILFQEIGIKMVKAIYLITKILKPDGIIGTDL